MIIPDNIQIDMNTLNQPVTVTPKIKYLAINMIAANALINTKEIPNFNTILRGLSEKAMIVAKANLSLFLKE